MCVTNTVNKRASALTLKAPHALLGFKPEISSLQLPRKAGAGVSLTTPLGRPTSTMNTSTKNCFPTRTTSTPVHVASAFSRNCTKVNGQSSLLSVNHGTPSELPKAAKPTKDSNATVAPKSSITSKPPPPAWLKGEKKEKPKSKRRRKPQKPGKTAMMNDRHFVKHNYHDHADEPYDFEGDDNVAEEAKRLTADGKRRGGVVICFPSKLHEMLDQIEADGLASVISWMPHGRAFTIHRPREFTEYVMPKYFRQTKLTSFQRQLNLYGFARLTRGADNGAYYHELFLRGRPKLGLQMVRTKVKGTGFKAASSPDSEPDFYKMKPVLPFNRVSASSSVDTPVLSDDDTLAEMSDDASPKTTTKVSPVPPVRTVEVQKPPQPLASKALRHPVAVLGEPVQFPSGNCGLPETSPIVPSAPEAVPTASITFSRAGYHDKYHIPAEKNPTEDVQSDFDPPRSAHNLDPFRPTPINPDRAVTPPSSSSLQHAATRNEDAVLSSPQITPEPFQNHWHRSNNFQAQQLTKIGSEPNEAYAQLSALFDSEQRQTQSMRGQQCVPLAAQSSSSIPPISPVQRKGFTQLVPSASSPAASFALRGDVARCDTIERFAPRRISKDRSVDSNEGCDVLDEVVSELLSSGNKDIMCDFAQDWNPAGDIGMDTGLEDDDADMSDAVLGRLLDEFLG